MTHHLDLSLPTPRTQKRNFYWLWPSHSLSFVMAGTGNNTPPPGRTMKVYSGLQRKSVGRLSLSFIISIFSMKYTIKSFDGSEKEEEEPDRRCNLPGMTLTWSTGLP